jgi:hypothetical protein
MIWLHKKKTFDKDQKMTFKAEEICSKGCKVFFNVLQEAYIYKYEDEPRYGVLIFLLENELLNMSCVPDNYFNFSQKIPDYHGRNLI